MNEILIDPTIEFFEWYNLYFLPVEKIEFDFQTRSMRLVLMDYETREDQEIDLQLIFKEVHKYTFEYPQDEFLFEMRAIYRAKITKLEENNYELYLLIDMPKIETRHDKHDEITVGKMLIGFADLEVIGGLSREAMEYKWKVEE